MKAIIKCEFDDSGLFECSLITSEECSLIASEEFSELEEDFFAS